MDGIPTVGGGSFPREGGKWGTALHIDPPPNSPEQCPSSAEHLAPPRRRASRPGPGSEGESDPWP